jgi:lipopolysaccharide/colanic/teichoic acid biosynthesis glycosyltransferase
MTNSTEQPYRGKRALDLTVAGVACLAFAPLAAGIAIATLLEDGGPTLFSQPRVGRQRQPFTILKFRSMREGQVTRLGQWLRRTGIDELPQFINVVLGDMSVVGPRPLTLADIERLGWSGPQHDRRFATRPGITGLSQLLAGRGARSTQKLDRLYLQQQSLTLDVQLIALSFAVNMFGKAQVRRWLTAARDREAARHCDCTNKPSADPGTSPSQERGPQ